MIKPVIRYFDEINEGVSEHLADPFGASSKTTRAGVSD